VRIESRRKRRLPGRGRLHDFARGQFHVPASHFIQLPLEKIPDRPVVSYLPGKELHEVARFDVWCLVLRRLNRAHSDPDNQLGAAKIHGGFFLCRVGRAQCAMTDALNMSQCALTNRCASSIAASYSLGCIAYLGADIMVAPYAI
jgi:hypothetical protein